MKHNESTLSEQEVGHRAKNLNRIHICPEYFYHQADLVIVLCGPSPQATQITNRKTIFLGKD